MLLLDEGALEAPARGPARGSGGRGSNETGPRTSPSSWPSARRWRSTAAATALWHVVDTDGVVVANLEGRPVDVLLHHR